MKRHFFPSADNVTELTVTQRFRKSEFIIRYAHSVLIGSGIRFQTPLREAKGLVHDRREKAS